MLGPLQAVLALVDAATQVEAQKQTKKTLLTTSTRTENKSESEVGTDDCEIPESQQTRLEVIPGWASPSKGGSTTTRPAKPAALPQPQISAITTLATSSPLLLNQSVNSSTDMGKVCNCLAIVKICRHFLMRKTFMRGKTL